MFRFLSRSFPHLRSYVRTSQTQNLVVFQLNQFSSAPTETSTSIVGNEEKLSFKVRYLVKKCGFTLKRAVSASKRFNFETPEKPDSVISFFKNQRFTESQISNVLKLAPSILTCDPEKTLLPKIRFFESLGFSLADTNRILSKAPQIFRRNVEQQLIPSVEFIKDLVKSDEKTIACLKRYPTIFRVRLGHQASLCPNISLLREIGVPEANIVYLVTYQPRLFFTKHAKFKSTVEEVKKLGFRPVNMNFSHALHVLRGMSKLTWEKKVQIYKMWGWSETEILEAFGKQPLFISASEDKIMGVMDFFVNQMGFEHAVLLQRPGLLVLSLQKRIKPRCMVYKALFAKGLIKKKFSVATMLQIPEEKFLERFVECYKAEAPELLDIYKRNLPSSK